MTDEQTNVRDQELLGIIEEWKASAEKRKRLANRIFKPCYALGIISKFVFSLAYLGYKYWNWQKPSDDWEMISSWLAFPAMVCLFFHYRSVKKVQVLAEKVSHFDDLRAVPFLVDALTHYSVAYPQTVVSALICLLPRIKASDTSLLTELQRLVLYKSMIPAGDMIKGTEEDKAAYRLAVLQAVTQIGDDKAIPYLNVLISVSKTNSEVRTDAEDALQAIEQRMNESRDSRTLLRASDDTASISTLLKPAMPNDVEQDNLLRPVIQ